MAHSNRIFGAVILRTAQGKLYYEILGVPEDGHQEPPFPDALDFPGESARGPLKDELRARCPGIEPRYDEKRLDFVANIRSSDAEVDREEFVDSWRDQLEFEPLDGFGDFLHPFHRVVRVKLTGADRVRWWSGWFHYPLLIENSRREMEESGERLVKLLDPDRRRARDVIEEAYFEQVMRARLAIFERRREWWRVIRWGLTTALGSVLAACSGIQIWQYFFGG